MYKKQILLSMIILGITVQLGLADAVKFKSSSTDKNGKTLTLTGILTKPEGISPFPAVILLHGCGGFVDSKSRSEAWSERLVNWGYVTLMVDSFGPRGLSNICSDLALISYMLDLSAQDAYDAKDFLAELPVVDRNRIALMGFSLGGGVALKAVNKWLEFENKKSPFKAAISFYPYCKMLRYTDAPLLILIGELDQWTQASLCTEKMPKGKTENEIILKIYFGAYHGFDWEGLDEVYDGYRLLYDPVATQDSIVQVKSFLAKYLK